MKLLIFCVLSMLVASNEGVSVNCRSEPETNDGKNGETAVDDGQSFTLTCDVSGGQGNNVNDHIKTCSWEHYETENENRGNNYEPDIQCNFAEGNSMDSNCNSDQRLRGQTSKTSCQLTVQNSKPDDTGDWTVDIFTDQKSTQTLVVYTYNQSYVEMLDDTEGNRDHRSSVDTKYNWNDKQNDWEKDESNYESVELICYAAGGRPLPIFVWSINNDDLEDDDVFDISGTGEDHDHSVARSYGYNNIIQDMESTLKFTVNPELLERLRNKHNVDTNPENGDFSFDIDCQVEQDGIQTSTESMRVDVQKSYDDGHLKGSTIGIIVGCIVAVILLVAAIALLVFAKASNRWCFADDDYQYRDPKSRDNRPRGPGPQGPQGPPQQQQVHTREGALDKLEPAVIPASTKISPTSPNNAPSNNKPPISSRRSSSSSGHNNTTADVGTNIAFGAKASPRVQGEWIDQDRGQTTKTNIIRTHKQSSKRSATSGHSSSSSNNMTNMTPPPRPHKPSELQYANLDRNFMSDPRNQVLPTVINVNPNGSTAPIDPAYHPPTTSPYATIVTSSSSSRIVSSEKRVNGELVSQSVHREEYQN